MTYSQTVGYFLADELEIVDNAEKVAFEQHYIVDEDNIIQHVSVNALDTGRNHEEIEEL